jgi:dipeptidyl aminopeptidase/acylaminoacyl peptidase
LSEGCVSPDGKVLAYTVRSETPTDPHFNRQGTPGQTRVCLFEEGQESVLLENAFQPSWSPDGNALALLDADVNEARLKVYWRNKGTWAVLRHAAIGYGGGPGYVWMPNQNLLVATQLDPQSRGDVSVLDSQALATQPRQALVEWNPDTGTQKKWAQGVFSQFCPSPDGQQVVAVRIAELSFPNTARANPPGQLVLLDGSGQARPVEAVSNPKTDCLRWSDDGEQLVCCDEFGHWWQVRADSAKANPMPNEVTDCCWIGNELAVRSDAWRVGEKVLLPSSARFFGDSSSQVAVSEGHVYQLDPKSEPKLVADLPANQPFQVERQNWPVVLRQGNQRSLLDRQGQVRQLADTKMLFFAANGGKVWVSNAEHTQLREVDGQNGPQLAMPESGDRLLSQAAEAGGSDWVLLPSIDKPGPYPTVVWLQPGRTYSSDTPPQEALLSNQSGGLNARLLSAQGYAVYFPNLPEGKGEPSVWLDQSIQAALRRMTTNSNIDLRRLAVMGQGYGGYATLMAATQSHPFKAAIALSAFGDLSSDYARLSPATRLSQPQDALPFVHRQSHYYEQGQMGMGLPPWQDPQRWVRNSPYYQAGRVQLPVLLISGNQDGHLPQAEQFFTALYRQGKPARLVRYQDESHQVGRADHVVDEWRQIHTWLERYLGDEATGVKPKSGT